MIAVKYWFCVHDSTTSVFGWGECWVKFSLSFIFLIFPFYLFFDCVIALFSFYFLVLLIQKKKITWLNSEALPLFFPVFNVPFFYPPESIRKPSIFRCFEGDQKRALERKVLSKLEQAINFHLWILSTRIFDFRVLEKYVWKFKENLMASSLAKMKDFARHQMLTFRSK